MLEMIRMTPALRKHLAKLYGQNPAMTGSDEQVLELMRAIKAGKLSAKDAIRLGSDGKTGTGTKKKGAPNMRGKTGAKGKGLVAGASGGANADVRVKSPFARFNKERPLIAAKSAGGIKLPAPSELDRAKMATFIKYSAHKSGVPGVVWTEDDQARLAQMFKEDKWQIVKGLHDEEEISGERARAILAEKAGRFMTIENRKSLLDDTTSGGLEVAPIYFDDLLTTYPVLNGELFPFVDVIDIPRGRRIEAGSMQNPTVTWGTTEGAAISEFNTNSLVGPIDTTIYNVVMAITVGLDFLSDAGVDIGSALVEQIGQVAAGSLDDVIAGGDGVTQPLGMFNTSGATAVNSDNSGSGPVTVGDLEGLYFGLPKQYRKKENGCRFVMNDVSYRRFRAIPVGPTDERRVLGMAGEVGSGTAGLDSYNVYGCPVSINQNTIANNQAAFAAMKLYRMYRRLGTTFSWYQEGDYLARRNLRLLVVRGRFGGQYRIPSALAVMSDLQQ